MINYTVQVMVEASWMTIGQTRGHGATAAFEAFSAGKRDSSIVVGPVKGKVSHYGIGRAQYRLTPCRPAVRR